MRYVEIYVLRNERSFGLKHCLSGSSSHQKSFDLVVKQKCRNMARGNLALIHVSQLFIALKNRINEHNNSSDYYLIDVWIQKNNKIDTIKQHFYPSGHYKWSKKLKYSCQYGQFWCNIEPFYTSYSIVLVSARFLEILERFARFYAQKLPFLKKYFNNTTSFSIRLPQLVRFSEPSVPKIIAYK